MVIDPEIASQIRAGELGETFLDRGLCPSLKPTGQPPCPLWVKRGRSVMLEVRLLYPRKRTSELAFNLVAPATFATLAAMSLSANKVAPLVALEALRGSRQSCAPHPSSSASPPLFLPGSSSK